MKRVTSICLVLAFACSNKKGEILSNNQQSPVAVQKPSMPQEDQSSKISSPETSTFLIIRSFLNKVEVLIPNSFEIMDAEMIALKYPAKQRAAFQVYTDEDAVINIALEHTPNKATLQDLVSIKEVFERQFNQPGIDFKKCEIKQINGRSFIVIEMITSAMDTEVYNLMFVTSLEGKLLIGTFNCTIGKLKEWKPLAEQILNSVKVKD